MENFETYRLDQTGQQTQDILDQVSTNTADIAQLRALYEALTQNEPVIIQPSDTWPVADPQENVIYRVIDRVNTPPQSYSDYMWNGTTMVLMATYNNAIDDVPTPGSNNLVKSGGVYQKIINLCKSLGLVADGASIDVDNLKSGIVNVVCAGVPSGCPSEVNYGGGIVLVTMRASDDKLTMFDTQYIISDTTISHRSYYEGDPDSRWLSWTTDKSCKSLGIVADGASIDVDNLKSGIINVVCAGVPSGCPSEVNYGGGIVLVTMRASDNKLTMFDTQYIISDDAIYHRSYYESDPDSRWLPWQTTNAKKTIECGTGKQYTRLRDAVEAAIVNKGSQVVVYPGIYDLTQEFATELANHSGTGILLTNDVHLLFMPGAYVTCMVDVSNTWAYEHFEPFRCDRNFTLENANIKCKNTRYCVHDELGGAVAQYIHKYLNCSMEYVNENQNATFVQCIGGGLGQNGYIEIIGGYYKSYTYYAQPMYPSPDDFQQPITYHNGDNANADSHIIIRDVYLADKGYLRFGNYGPSTKLTPVQVCGCRMYKPILLMNETGDPTQVQNFEIISFNNEIINP